MDFKTYWKGISPELQAAFAARVERSPRYLYLVAMGHNDPSPDLVVAIEHASGGLVPRTRWPRWAHLWPAAA